MIGIGTLTKLAKGTFTKDELEELLSQLGLEMAMNEVQPGGAEQAFYVAALAANRQDAKLLTISGGMKNGDRIEALIVLIPAAGQAKNLLTGRDSLRNTASNSIGTRLLRSPFPNTPLGRELTEISVIGHSIPRAICPCSGGMPAKARSNLGLLC